MSFITSPFWFLSSAFASGTFYPYSIDQSLRFNDSDSSKLSRTPSSNGNRQTFTISFWMKRANIGIDEMRIFSSNFSTDGFFELYFEDTDEIVFKSRSRNVNGADFDWSRKSVRKFRDIGSWYHIVIAVDVTVSSPTSQLDLFTFYLNGEDITSNFSTVLNTERAATSSQVDQYWNSTTEHNIGSDISSRVSTEFFDGYLAEFHHIDGTALTPTSFGELKNGIWIPKEYDIADGAYGTNGFYLNFSDNSTASALGTDSSGKSNNFSVSNLATSDKVLDSPTKNFATINNLYRGQNTNTAAYGLTSEGNLKYSYSDNSDAGTLCTHAFASRKYYWELRIVAGGSNSAYQHGTGIANVGAGYTKVTNIMDGRDPNEIGMNSYTGEIRQGSSTVINTLSTTNMANGSIIGCAVDADNGAIYWSYNGTFMNSSDPTSGASKTNAHATWTPADGDIWVPTVLAGGGTVPVNVINFGQDSTFAGGTTAGGNTDENGYGNFKYAPPSGYLALSTVNLPEPDIGPNSTTTSDKHFNTVLYTGNGTAIGSGGNVITGVGFQPDWVWIKERNGVADHGLYDVVRGTTKQLESNTTTQETTESEGLTTFGSDGFTIGSLAQINTNTDTYVAWNWKAGSTAVSNTSGSITSSVSTNQNAKFSIVSYTGNGTAGATVGHGLSSVPDMIIVKNRDQADAWQVYHSANTANPETDYLVLNDTAATSDALNRWNDTAPTLSVFSLGDGVEVNTNTENYIAYCFHSVDGFSKAGSYIGNGGADGPFIYTGFKPAWVMVKRTVGGTSDWDIMDSERGPYNIINERLYANLSDAEASADLLDFTSNGFKIRNTAASQNISGSTYIYLAFAEAPFKYANAR